MKEHQKYMLRCIELAQNGLGQTYPNPMVGCVIVHQGKIIGEGWHRKAGEPHAEVNAIQSVKDKSKLEHATIYVSLEPCSHYGKTPPCCDLITAHKIPNVVVGTIDSFAQVSGRGIRKLKEAGKNVIVGILENECRNLNKRFFTFLEKKRPYIILKWAESADGFLAPSQKNKQEPVWLSNQFSRQLVHKWRTEEQSILVGTQTVLDDNPKLNVRDWSGTSPIRVIFDRTGRISENFSVKDRRVKTIVFTELENLISDENLIYETIIFDEFLTENVMEILYLYGIQSIIIEGGKKTINSFLKAGLWDEARIFKSNLFLNEGVSTPDFQYTKTPILRSRILKDELLIFQNHD
ncbi:MAG: bifunctional diaminohydroxyphosphoribosylaminopyrimidine deaminase/5-amino-6-(5-phosphoribosylamino)uracil reductase RibD [Flavobacteriaceae bacterium]|nr:bifunctional diaminohydroxyphosphoribosylaminopyrimidine deaminase/5-amino-6-(5-phosphoribosylamino)uracil reductase RibD [Flavobacteriaceae bacterium]